MKNPNRDAYTCFPTGKHYEGIANLLTKHVQGLSPDFAPSANWRDLPVALIDVETTGFDASRDRVIELGIAIGRYGAIVARYNWIVNPTIHIPAASTAVHGIRTVDVQRAPRFADVAPRIVAALSGTIPAAYNAQFDRAFVLNELARAGLAGPRADVEWIDPLVWARAVHSEHKSRKLSDVAARLGLPLDAHRAADDAEVAMRALYLLAEQSGPLRVPATYGGLIAEQRRLSRGQADVRKWWKPAASAQGSTDALNQSDDDPTTSRS